MADPVKQLQLVETPEKIIEIKERIFQTHTEELVIGLCGPIGTDIHFVADSLKGILEANYSYKCQVIKLSKLIRNFYSGLVISPQDGSYEKKKKLIDAGNELRKLNGNSILAEFAINEIAVSRE